MLAELPLAMSLAETPPAVDIPIQGVTSAVGATTDGLAALDESHALDDFSAEPEALSPEDSPRELARKMIAAREVRKRQVKRKTDKAIDDGATTDEGQAPPSESQLEPAIVPESVPVAGVLLARQTVEPAPAAALETVENVTTPVVEIAAPQSPLLEPATPTRSEELVGIPRLEPVDLTATPRDLSDRVVAVDEFRAREAAAVKGRSRLAACAGADDGGRTLDPGSGPSASRDESRCGKDRFRDSSAARRRIGIGASGTDDVAQRTGAWSGSHGRLRARSCLRQSREVSGSANCDRAAGTHGCRSSRHQARPGGPPRRRPNRSCRRRAFQPRQPRARPHHPR